MRYARPGSPSMALLTNDWISSGESKAGLNVTVVLSVAAGSSIVVTCCAPREGDNSCEVDGEGILSSF